MRFVLYALGLCSIDLLRAGAEPAQAAKLTGWFACEKCTASRVAKGDLRPSNPDCARQCIDKGTAAVFISEQGRELLKVSETTRQSRKILVITSKSPAKSTRLLRQFRSRRSRGSQMREPRARAGKSNKEVAPLRRHHTLWHIACASTGMEV